MTNISTTTPVDFAAGAGHLGLAEQEVRELVALRLAGDCVRVQARMAELVAARLAQVQGQLGAVLAEQASALEERSAGGGGSGPGVCAAQGDGRQFRTDLAEKRRQADLRKKLGNRLANVGVG